MSTKQIKVKRVVVHKDYKAPTFENDIAVLELDSAISRQPHIVPICLPSTLNEVFEGRTGIVTGWGRLEYGIFIQSYLELLKLFRNYIIKLSWFKHERNHLCND